MLQIGRFNTLPIVKTTSFGLYLDGGTTGEILLPNRYITADMQTEPGTLLTVFIYRDSEDRLIATTQRPRAQVGGFANLQIVSINRTGLFLDWGLPKDLLLPHSEIRRVVNVGDFCVVYVCLDPHTQRLIASTRLDRYIDYSHPSYQIGEKVDILITERTDLGYKTIINNKHWGLLHKNELFKTIKIGQRHTAYIRHIRDDGNIGLSLQPIGQLESGELSTRILKRLNNVGGSLPLSDKSTPELIDSEFGVSKAAFKKAIGSLYKKGLIKINPDSIMLI